MKLSRLAFPYSRLCWAVAFFSVAYALTWTEGVQRLENMTVDGRMRLRALIEPAALPEDLALVAIDERSLRDFGRWPWPWAQHGDLLQLLGRKLPSVVAWDFLFTEAGESKEADDLMSKGIEASGAAVVLGAMREDPTLGIAPNAPQFAAARLTPLSRITGDQAQMLQGEEASLPAGRLAQVADIGFVDTPPDIDGVTRLLPLIVRVGDRVYPSLALLALMQHWGVTAEQVEVRLGEAIILDRAGEPRRIPIDRRGRYLVNFRYSIELDNISVHGYSRLNELLYRQLVEKRPETVPEVTGKILLVGQSADALTDLGPTPLAARMPLVLVHANALANILAGDYARPIVSWPWLTLGALGLAGLARFSERKLREQAVFSLGVPVAYALIVTALWIQGGWLLPVVGPLLGFAVLQIYMIGGRVLAEQRAKEQIKGMFSSYLAPEVVRRLLSSGTMPKLGGHEAEITAYFSDIQGFSTFSEQLPPDRLVELMNEYLTACTEIVQEEGGTLDKYIGDAVVAIFGAPVPLPDHAQRACVAAWRVQAKQAELREKWAREGRWPKIVTEMQTRIGLNTGRCIIGNMGSRMRFSYTMMGDDVNLAARMESGAKTWGVHTMCSEATKLASERHGDRLVFRPLGRIVVKGRTQAVAIYEIMGLRETLPSATTECIARFTEGLKRYCARDWEGALANFTASAALEPKVPGKTPGIGSNPSLIYQDMISDLRGHELPEAWDGVYEMKEK